VLLPTSRASTSMEHTYACRHLHTCRLIHARALPLNTHYSHNTHTHTHSHLACNTHTRTRTHPGAGFCMHSSPHACRHVHSFKLARATHTHTRNHLTCNTQHPDNKHPSMTRRMCTRTRAHPGSAVPRSPEQQPAARAPRVHV